jgi:hypothetical protein
LAPSREISRADHSSIGCPQNSIVGKKGHAAPLVMKLNAALGLLHKHMA